MKCKKDNGSYTTVTWKYYYSGCTKTQQNLGICYANIGAFVPAVTVCNQRLF